VLLERHEVKRRKRLGLALLVAVSFGQNGGDDASAEVAAELRLLPALDERQGQPRGQLPPVLFAGKS